MKTEELIFLNSDEGVLSYNKYKEYSDLELNNLLLKSSKKKILYISAVVSLIKLRRKAENKFSKNNSMFFTNIGLEQATTEKISKYIAKRFNDTQKVVDLTCGIGGNLFFLAKNVQEAIAVDKDDVNLECAKINSKIYGVDNKIKFILGDAFNNIIKDADAFFIDPSRARDGRTKTRSILNSKPNIIEILPKIFKVTNNVCVKISPAFDYIEINLLPEKPEIEVISEDGVCKVVLLWFGRFKSCDRKATCIIKDKIYSYSDNPTKENIKIVDKPLNYLYKPNKAITKARLVDEVAGKFKLKKINPKTSFLTSDKLIQDRKELFRIFKVIHYDKFAVKEIKKKLKEKNIERINIITKRFPQKPEDIYKKIKVKEGGNWFLIITVLANEKYCYILTEKS